MASSESSSADELAIPKDRLQLLGRALPRVQKTHLVTVSLLPTTAELAQQWVRVEGPATGRGKAKEYIKALCSPEVEMDVSYSRPLHCIWTGAGGAWHRAVENLSGAAVMVTDVGTLRVSGTDMQVMMAVSTLENLQTVYKDSVRQAASRESLDQDRRFSRLLRTVGDGSACDEQLQQLPSAVKQLLMEWMEEDTENASMSGNADLDLEKSEVGGEESSDSSFEVVESEPPAKAGSENKEVEKDAMHQEDTIHAAVAFLNSGTESDMKEKEASNITSNSGLFSDHDRTGLSGFGAEAAKRFSVDKSSSHRKASDPQDHENVRFLKNFAARLQISGDLVDRAIADLGTGVDVNTLLDHIERLQSTEDELMELAEENDKQQKRQASSDEDVVEIPVSSNVLLKKPPQESNDCAMQSTSKVNRTEDAMDVSTSKGVHAVKPQNQENVRFLKKFARDFDIPEFLVDRAVADLGSEVDVNTMLDHIGMINSGEDAVVMETGDDNGKQQNTGSDDDIVAIEKNRSTTEESGPKGKDISSACKICRDLGYDDEDIALALSRVGEEASLGALIQEIRTVIEEKDGETKKKLKPEASGSKAGESVTMSQTRSTEGGMARGGLRPDYVAFIPPKRNIPPPRYGLPRINQSMSRPVVLLPTPVRGMVRPYYSLAADVQAQNQFPVAAASNRAPPSASQSSAAGTRDTCVVQPKQHGQKIPTAVKPKQQSNHRQEEKTVPTQGEKSQKEKYKLDLPDVPGDNNLRPVVVDGSNVAMSHGKRAFSSRGIAICTEYFWKRGHRDITVFVPNFRKGASVESHLLLELEEKDLLSFTPSRRIKGRTVASYDDRYIVRLAAEKGGIIVSNDNYRDLLDESEAWRDAIENRLLLYTFVGDLFMPPDDPLGRDGPSLDDFLRKPSKKKHRGAGHKVSPQRSRATHTGGGNNPLQQAPQQPLQQALQQAPQQPAPISPEQLQLYQQLTQVFPGQEEKIQRVLQMHPEMADLNAVSAMVLDVDV